MIKTICVFISATLFSVLLTYLQKHTELDSSTSVALIVLAYWIPRASAFIEEYLEDIL